MKAILILGDSRKFEEIVEELGLPKVTLLLTDPPYHAKLTAPTKYRGKIINMKDMYAGDHETSLKGIESVIKSGILASDVNVVTFVEKGPGQCEYHNLFLKHGFKYKQKLYLFNVTPMPQVRKVAFRTAIQEILWYVKGKAPFNFLGQSEMKNVFEWHPAAKWRETQYPTEKPLFVFEKLVKVLSNEGDWILDPFCGSGTTAVASLKNGRNVICVDISEEALKVQKERLEKWGFEYEEVEFNS